jgi:hypothetical protein
MMAAALNFEAFFLRRGGSGNSSRKLVRGELMVASEPAWVEARRRESEQPGI